ncbi:MAG: ATP-binding protein [Saprospiraceae bacterium]|nr:ATP-binding protein [Saprospiraceae bacterium]
MLAQRAQKNEPSFQASITFQIAEPLIRVYDNGYGVNPEVETQIFQPFITTKPRNVGRGLGLFITQQLTEALGCEVYLLQQRNSENRRYIFQLNFEPITT